MSDVMLIVNGITMPCPYKYVWTLHDVSDADAGRTQDAIMHKNLVAQKVELEVAWRYKSWEEASFIIRAFNSGANYPYMNVTYPDMNSGAYITKTFYRSDPKVSAKFWWSGARERKLLEEISFNLIEQ